MNFADIFRGELEIYFIDRILLKNGKNSAFSGTFKNYR